MRSIGEQAGAEKVSKTPTFLIKQLQEHVENDRGVKEGKPYYANVHCDLTWVFVPENTDRQMFYHACEVCKKKVMPDGAGFSCESCNRTFKKSVPTYNFSIKVSDCSGSISIGCFGEIGETVLGINCQQFFAIHEDAHAVKELTLNRLHENPMTLVIRAKADFNAGEQVVRYTAVRAVEHSYQNANENLLK